MMLRWVVRIKFHNGDSVYKVRNVHMDYYESNERQICYFRFLISSLFKKIGNARHGSDYFIHVNELFDIKNSRQLLRIAIVLWCTMGNHWI